MSRKEQMQKILLLAVLYVVTGKLGLLLAVPPGYATIIWPPSGIAVGMLLMYGRRLWPGIFIGSFLLNCYIAGIYSLEGGLLPDKLAIATGIAFGSTLQSLAGYFLVRRFLGLPLVLNRLQDALQLFILTGPLASLIAATVGVGTLYVFGAVLSENLFSNWQTWWLGDMLGVLIFMPLVLLAPGSPHGLTWHGQKVGTLPVMALLILMLPLGITFYAWKITSEKVYEASNEEFKALAQENEKALLHRMDSYNQALLGGAGFFQGSDHVSRKEWEAYADNIDLRKEYPGINGIGYIEDVSPGSLHQFVQDARKDGAPDFDIHPLMASPPYLIIKYIEPLSINRQALGLNITFEMNRYTAATLARDNGKAAVTRRILLVQDKTQSPGFLLLHPFYKKDMPLNTVKERRAALRGWIFAPFIAHNFMQSLTDSQGNMLHLHVYDGEVESADNLIFSSDMGGVSGMQAAYSVRKHIDIMQQRWTLVWTSTKAFEHSEVSTEPLFILTGGLLFTGLFALFLLLAASRTHTIVWLSEEKFYLLPLVVLTAILLTSFYLKHELMRHEERYIRRLVDEKAGRIEMRLALDMNDRLSALKRMAQRWEANNGTPSELWRRDAENYLADLVGLRALEWIDGDFHVRWIEPLKGNEKALGLNIIFDKARQDALKNAAISNVITLTPPLDLVQGYRAFIAYAPIHIGNRFDGFIAGIFGIEELLHLPLAADLNDYGVSFLYQGKEFFRDGNPDGDPRFTIDKDLTIYDKKWAIRITPSAAFVANNFTQLPHLVFNAGVLIALLAALAVRYILLSKVKTGQLVDRQAALEASEETFRSAMESASIGMALVGLDGKWLQVNNALCSLVGYSKDELLQTDFQHITHPEDLEVDLEYVRMLLTGKMPSYQMEKRYIHKDGHLVWVLLAASLVRSNDGSPKHFVAQVQDITGRRQVERMKSEFISTVSHELRTPLTSIRGALGLIESGAAGDIPAKAMNLVQIAHKNSQRLVHIINDILDVEKIESGKLQVNICKVSVPSFLQQAVEATQAYGDKFGVRFVIEPPPAVDIMADPDRLMQIMANLLSNAAKFSPAGSEVTIRARHERSKVRFEVSDKGTGIPEEFRGRIFGKFAQADSSDTRSHEGTGLGLNIAKQLVELMGGEIGFETETGKGTCFYFYMPESPPMITLLPENSCYRLLLVENDSALTLFLQSVLEQVGFMVDTAGSIPQARAKLSQGYYSAMLIDMFLPLGDGMDFVRELRASPITRDLPVVALSSKADRKKLHIDNTLGVVSCLSKPIDATKLMQVLEHIIAGGKSGLPLILHVEDDQDLTHVLAQSVQGSAMVISAPTLAIAKYHLGQRRFDLAVVDLSMPDGSGEELLDTLNDQHTPIIILSANETSEAIKNRVTTCLVKSRLSEAVIVNTILSLLPYAGTERKRVRKA